MFRYIVMAVLAAVLLTGCLTPVYKEYTINVNPDGSGSGTIRFVDIISGEPWDEGEIQSDFRELIEEYLGGSYFEEDYYGMTVKEKKLYEEDGVLVGQIDFNFKSLSTLKFYRYEKCDCCPWMNTELLEDEHLIETNGEFIYGDPIVYIWPSDVTTMEFKTVLAGRSDGVSLLPQYKEWEEK